MNKPQFWQTDHFSFQLEGKNLQKFLSGAATRGVRLNNVHLCEGGVAAGAPGRDYKKIQALAQKGGWTLTVLSRRGPGRWLERCAGRCGVVVGAILFLVLTNRFSNYIWVIDYGALDQLQQHVLNLALDENGLSVGAKVSEDKLRTMQRELLVNSGEYGWLSLNFTGGCLFVESTEAEKQQITPDPVNTALYASDDALILKVKNIGGFSDVAPGQTVAKGQLLVWAEKRDRSGNAVAQAATGQIIGRVIKSYTAECPQTSLAEVLTGRSYEVASLLCMGLRFKGLEEENPYPNGKKQAEWEPITFGRLALPACFSKTVYWEKETILQKYSEEEAAGIAARNCMLQLLAEYPDAIVEEKQQTLEQAEGTVRCNLKATFQADIASQEENHTELPPFEGN